MGTEIKILSIFTGQYKTDRQIINSTFQDPLLSTNFHIDSVEDIPGDIPTTVITVRKNQYSRCIFISRLGKSPENQETDSYIRVTLLPLDHFIAFDTHHQCDASHRLNITQFNPNPPISL